MRRRIADRIRQVTALAVATTFLSQNYAWAICSDGSTLPEEGFVIGQPPLVDADNWSPGVFTGTTGSLWIPDSSVFEHNDPTQPLTGGGHNWVFDQGSTLCKMTDTGPANSLPTGWKIEPNSPNFCVILPVIVQGRVTNFGDIPFQGDAITPTCDPTQYVNNDPITGPAQSTNTYFNHLGCSISHGVTTTPQTATSFLFVAGIKGGMFSIPLDNAINPEVGGDAGKTISGQSYYSQIPSGSLLTGATVSKDGQFAIATSRQRDLRVWGCLNPLGDPGDFTQAINPYFFVPPGSDVLCMEVGSNNLATDLTTTFGPDNQPYFGGQRVVNTFNSVPGSSDLNPVATAWPNCIWQTTGAASLSDAFINDIQNGCASAQPNFAFASALITQPNAMISHGKYMYAGPIGGTIYQFLVKVNPFSGLSEYRFRSFVTGLSIVTGLGTDDALQSLFIYTDPTAIGLAGREFVTKVPLCEDMDGEVVTIVSNPPPGAPGATGNTGATAGNGAQGIFANVPLPGAGTNAPVGAGGLLFVGGGVGAGTTPTTGANATTTLPAVTPAAATTTIPAAANAATGAGPASGTTTNAPVTLSVPPAFTTPGANALTGIGILAIGGIPTGFPASGILTGPGFTVKLVPNPGG
jgi:hypothetical protein